ncbi:exonuclease [Palleronia abyssalis]|uniref:Exonuclease domain-containing protein n=1 Tax=Palleronia abyssalis TaxID=1501240 RepID=A0A2R8BU11_9RHOB|nr:exonuclease [Palleronia abyssalis]SPJ23641.1 hypothetical protein PAA8504_01454 [Palleronia abyssalis]
MDHAIIFDCEFLTAPGAPQRFWCGPRDPDPVIAQIGLVKLGLEGDFAMGETLRTHVVPRNRNGDRQPLDPLFIRLTGITEADIDAGLQLADALEQVRAFADGARLWSWGKDEFNAVAISCYVEGIAPPLPIKMFANACDLLLSAGMPYEDLIKTRSNTLAGYYGLDQSQFQGHDALGDALSVASVLQHLLRDGALDPAAFGA